MTDQDTELAITRGRCASMSNEIMFLREELAVANAIIDFFFDYDEQAIDNQALHTSGRHKELQTLMQQCNAIRSQKIN